tara:strand:- start:2828 stop:3097 length:270 start_codon:yes stop_codon:yes gene_type:complete
MAYTASFIVKTVKGNQREEQIRVTADAASGSVDTGLSIIDFMQHSPQSCTTGAYRAFMNTSEALATSNGTVALSGLASGDVLFLTVVGR